MPETKKAVVEINKGSHRPYGWVPDLPDHRDYLYWALRHTPAALPSRVDLRPFCSNVEDQGDLGSCTANALAGALEYLEKKDMVPCADLSRLFIYYNVRVIGHSIASDSGAMLRDGMKTLAKLGVCTERRWPYAISRFTKKPGSDAYKEAIERRITSYHRIRTLNEMRSCLAGGFPFVFGFTVYESFESEKTARTGIADMPHPDECALRGQAVMAVGYDDEDRRFIVRNSWGVQWGMNGYFTMPYAYAADRDLSDDFWTIRRGEKR